MHEDWNLFEIPSPTSLGLGNLPTLTGLLCLQIACSDI
jgi:hypothetical protein